IKFNACTPSAATSHGSDAFFALAHRRAVSIFEKRNASSAMLTAIFTIITTTRRVVEAGADSSGILLSRRTRNCTTDSSRSSPALTVRSVERWIKSRPCRRLVELIQVIAAIRAKITASNAHFDDRAGAVLRAARYSVQ